MGSKRISRTIIVLFLGVIISCSSNKGRPTSGFEGPGPVVIAPNLILGEGELLFAGGITSHWLYGVNLMDFYPFDINGSAEGMRIDNFSVIDDIATGIDGRFLLAGGDSVIRIYDVLNPETPSEFLLNGWVTSLVSDPLDPQVFYVTSWNGADGFLYKLKVKIDSGAIVVEPTLVNLPGMLPIKVMLTPDLLNLSPPLLYILFKTPHSIKSLDYSDLTTGFITEISFTEPPKFALPVSDGNYFYVIFDGSKLAKYSYDAIEVIQQEAPGVGETPRTIESVPMNIFLLPASDKNPEMVIIPDGKGYVDLIDSASGCPLLNASYLYKGFTDAGAESNPSLEEINVSSCNTKTEDWTISYHGKIFDSDRNTGKTYTSQDLFIDDTVNFIDLQLNPGDLLSVTTPDISGEYTVLEVIDQNTLRVDRPFSADSDAVVYNIKGVPYLVKGSESGIQKNRAYENERYLSDNGAITFKIVPKENPATEGDTFSISTIAERIKVEGLPYGVAVDSSNLIYVSNYGSNSISVIDPTQLKVIDTLR